MIFSRSQIIYSLLFIGFSSNAFSAGFYISEIGTPGSLGTAGVANVTNTFSADASWTNPAGMTALKDEQTLVSGVQVLFPKIEFDSSVAEAGGSDGGNAGDIVGIPSFFMTKQLSDDVTFGFSVVGTMGGGMDYGDDFVGRYAVTEVLLQGIFISPSLGYKVNDNLSLGAGVSFVYTQFEQEIAMPTLNPASDGKVKFDDLDDWGLQPFMGLTYQLNEKTLLGIVYRAEFDAELEGDIKFSNVTLPAATNKKMEIDWTNPQVLEIGLQYKLDDEYTFFVNADWEDWSEFSDNHISVTNGVATTLKRNFKDTWQIGFAVSKKMSEESQLALGFSYDSSPVDDDDRTLDLPFDEQIKLSAAYGWKENKNLDYSIGTTLMYAGRAKVDQLTPGGRVKGEFDKNYVLFVGATLRYLF